MLDLDNYYAMLMLWAFVTAFAAAAGGGAVASRLPRIRSWRSGATMPVGGAVMAVITMFVASNHTERIAGVGGDCEYVLICGFIGITFITLCLLRVIGAPSWLLLLATFGASFVGVLPSVRLQAVKLPFSTSLLSLDLLGAPLTCLWIAAITWVFGRTAELPGLTAGLGALTASCMFVLAMLQPQASGMNQEFVTVLALALAGACAGGFIPSLRSRTFAVGQAGSLTLGFCLAIITVLGALKSSAFLILLLPLLLVGAPLIDFSFALRRSTGEFAFTQAREPLHRALIRHGWQPVRVTFLYLAIEAYLCGLAILLVLLIRAHFTVKLLVLAMFGSFGWLFFTSIVKLLARPVRSTLDSQPSTLGTVDLHDLRISVVNMDQAVAQIEQFIQSRQPHMVVTSDASAIVRSRDDHELHRIINEADLVTPDGIGVIWSARFLDLPLYERVSGVDLALRLADLSARKGYSMFLFGAAPGVADEAASHLQQRFPGLRIVGTRNGFFSEEEEPAIVEQIKAAQPDLLLVAFGIPKQEKWIKRHLEALQVPVCIGVGGSFDVYAGRVPRAPLWMQRLGLEWLFRTVRDPKRIGRALLLPKLVVMTIRRRLAL